MLDRLSVLVAIAPILGVLWVCLPVLVDIAREGIERHRKWKAGEIEPYTEDPEFDAGPPAVLAPDGGTRPDQVRCRYCGATNQREFAVCRNCASWV
jgi:hypothetical protein